jgi:RHS repeat-associated protein
MYGYDAVGNRQSKQVGAGTETYSYSTTSNRISTITPSAGPVRSFTFDSNGSTTADGINTYVYDVRGRMMTATSTLGTTTYQVNALGQRVRKTNSLGDRAFVYDTSGNLIAESTAAGGPLKEYVWLGDTPLAVIDSNGRYFIHADHLNTPRLVANAAGTTVWKWDQQEPFGNNVPDENPSGLGDFDLPVRLPGQYFDKETNLHYNYFRYYQPALGRYGESDPMGLTAGLNTYAYVSSNPMSFTDPLGLQAVAPQPAIPSIIRPPQNPLRDPTREQRERDSNMRRCLTGQCGTPQYPSSSSPSSMCSWECPRSRYQCSPGDPDARDHIPGLGGLFPPASGCVWRCKPGPFFSALP